MTNEQILAGAVFFMNGNRKGRININATGKKFELGHYAMTEFKKFLRENHPEMLNLSHQYDAVHQDMHKVGVFQIVCVPTQRRVIATTKHSFLHAQHLHLHYLRNADTFSINNFYSKCERAKLDLLEHGVNSFKFEIIEIISNDKATSAFLRLRREEITKMFEDNFIYKVDANKTKELKISDILNTNNYSEEIRTLAMTFEYENKLLDSLRKNCTALCQLRLRLQQELEANTRRRSLIHTDIRNLNGQKKILRVRLQELEKKISLDRRRLNQLIQAHELLNLKPVGRPKNK